MSNQNTVQGNKAGALAPVKVALNFRATTDEKVVAELKAAVEAGTIKVESTDKGLKRVSEEYTFNAPTLDAVVSNDKGIQYLQAMLHESYKRWAQGFAGALKAVPEMLDLDSWIEFMTPQRGTGGVGNKVSIDAEILKAAGKHIEQFLLSIGKKAPVAQAVGAIVEKGFNTNSLKSSFPPESVDFVIGYFASWAEQSLAEDAEAMEVFAPVLEAAVQAFTEYKESMEQKAALFD
jgi:hypothetical protein